MRNVTESMKKYRIESVAALAFSIMSAIAFDIENQIPEKWFDVIAIVLLAAIVSFIVDKIFVIYENEIKQKLGSKEKYYNTAKWIIFDVLVIAIYLLCKCLISWNYTPKLLYDEIIYLFSYNNDGIKTLVVATIISLEVLFPIIIYFVTKEKGISLKQYLLKLFMNFIFVFILWCVVIVGIFVLYMICDALLGTIPYFIISRIIVFLLTIIPLMGLFISIESVDEKQSIFSKILVRYIMQIMVFIGFIIFYIYLIKIVIKFELPSNQVFAVCTTLFSLGLTTSLMSLGVNEESKYNIAIKFLPVAFIPALILQIISLALRIGQHGITTMRWLGIIIIVFEIVYLVLYILDEILEKEKAKLENILWVASLLALISYFVP